MEPTRAASIRIVATLFGLLLAATPPARAEGGALPPGVSPSWFAEAKANLEKMEYDFSRQPDGVYSAPNRAHDLRTRIGAEGVEVVSRVHGGTLGDGWRLTLLARSWGRARALEPFAAALPSFESERAIIDRAGVTESYVNDPKGLEQTFDLPAPPHGERKTGPLVLEMALGGNVLGNVTDDGLAVVFSSPSGKPVLHLGELIVTDSIGREIPARFRIGPGSLRLEIEDDDAVYPLHVDPLLTTAAWTAESNQAEAGFGFSVATAGDVNGDGFSDVLIGSVLYDNGEADEGRVSLYKGSASGLSASPMKNFEQNQAFADFGWSVSTAGDVNGDGYDDIVVGAPNWDDVASNGGAVFVYLGAPGILDDVADNVREGAQSAEHFGVSVAWAGDVDGDSYDDIIVGSPDYDAFVMPNFIADVGKAVLFFGDPADVLRTVGNKTFTQSQASARFGASVGTAGDVNGDGFDDVIVGAPSWDIGSVTDGGKVYGFYGSSTGPSLTPSWEEEFAEANAHFGNAIGTAGDTNGDGYSDVVIGAYLEDGSFTDEGAVFIYRGSATGIAASPSRVLRSGETSGQLGWFVGTAGDVNGDGYADVIAGAPFVDGAGTDRGRAYVWCGSSAGIGSTPCWQVDGAQDGAEFARAVATAGDVNGDGYSDVLVGAWQHDAGQTDEGRAFLYLGSGDGPLTTGPKILQAADTSNSPDFGFSVASAGDVNGDGFSDIIVGDPQNGTSNQGAAFVFLGTVTGPATTPVRTLGNDQSHDAFGQSVAGVGDVNGDGYDDVVVGAPLWSTDTTVDDENGRIYLFYGGPGGVDATADFQDSPRTGPGVFDSGVGQFAAAAGDVNGDGYADFLVGGSPTQTGSFLYYGQPGIPDVSAVDRFGGAQVAPAGDVNGDGFSDIFTFSPFFGGSGTVRVFYGGTGTLTGADWTRTSYYAGGHPAGDVNGDGYSDIVVSAGNLGGSLSNELYLGGSAGLGATASQTLPFNVSASATAGDVNGDGRSDLLVREYPETLYVFLGAATGLATTAGWTLTSATPGDGFSTSFASAGDVNGDGFDDIIVGAPTGSPGHNAQLFYGGGGDGLDRLPRQLRVSAFAPISLLGDSDLGDQAKLRLIRRLPAGRGDAGIRYQTALLGNAFGTGPSGTIDPTDTGAPGTGGSRTDTEQLLSGLQPESLYRWRARLFSGNPFFPRSKWFSVPGNNVSETDFRTPCLASIWYRDWDLDGVGDATVPLSACTQPSGYVATPGDCNEADPTIFPGHPEMCDGKDNDCNGSIDDGFLAPTARPSATASKNGSTIDLVWAPISGADRYDVVKGILSRLLVTGGDFRSSVSACVSNDNGHPTAADAALPANGSAFWYLIRAVNCNAAGSYDEGTADQIGLRDAEIDASGNSCP